MIYKSRVINFFHEKSGSVWCHELNRYN